MLLAKVSQYRGLAGVLIPALALIALLSGSYLIDGIPFKLAADHQIDLGLKFQIFGLALSLSVLILTLWLAPESRDLLRFGDLQNPSKPVKWLGIKATDSWRKTGMSYLLVITATTAIFMYLGLGKTADWSRLSAILPFVLLFSLTNSFSEEIISRFSVIGLLRGHLQPKQIMLVAALLFGSIHFFGNPGGPVGMLMAGFLGWLMAKAILETKGIGVAWGVHFVQDVVIYTLLLVQTNA